MTLTQRTAPSIARTVQALQTIRGRESRIRPEMRIVAIRSGGQPV